MVQLSRFYDLMKEEFASVSYLKTCKELYDKSKYKSQISSYLKDLGFKYTPEMESTLFFALVDIIVVVDSDDNFYYATFNELKLLELKQLGRLLPQKGETNYDKTISLVKVNTPRKINEYLSQGRFHFIKLNNLDCNSFYCNASGMNPYPKLTNERVYTLDFIAKTYWTLSNLLVRGIYRVNNIICTTSPVATQGKQLNSCASSCKFNVKTLEGVLEEIYLWNIHDVSMYYEAERLKPLYEGVCKVGDTYVTLSREMLERYYGSTYLEFESKGVRERYCLEELFDINSVADVRYYINKYKFYRDDEICSCRNVYELRSLLRSRMKPIKHDDKHINVRVLASPASIWKGYKSYYRTLSIDTDLRVVEDIESVMPQIYKVSGITNLGYCSVEVKAISGDSAERSGKEELKRQFGSLYQDKVLGVQRGSEVCKGKHPVFNISIETQRRMCEVMRWGYTQHYKDYSKYIRSVIATINIDIDVSDDMIKLLLINQIAKEAGRCDKVTLEILGSHLESFLVMLVKSTQEDVDKKLAKERKKLSKKKGD